MSKRLPMVFSHANGFPAPCYAKMFGALADDFDIRYLPRLAHNPAYPVSDGWPELTHELIDFVERGAHPVVAVGHSLGGLLSLLAVCKRPDLAAGLVMIDSPVITGWRAHSLQVVKATGLVRRVSPGRISRTRRHEWPDRDAVRAHFAAKAAFARWDPRVLEDYVRAGFEEHDGKTRLAFDRAVETRIYDTLPHHLGTLLHRHAPKCPVAFLAGTQSVEMRQGGIAASKALAHGRFATMEGGHLFPMEKPDETAAAVLQWVEGMGSPEARRL